MIALSDNFAIQWKSHQICSSNSDVQIHILWQRPCLAVLSSMHKLIVGINDVSFFLGQCIRQQSCVYLGLCFMIHMWPWATLDPIQTLNYLSF